VALLQLGGVRHSRVGSATQRGLSGGELKRLNIATELLGRPRLLFLDEPLTGLDSALAVTVIDALRAAATADRTTVMLTVHQPSSPIWAAFDNLMLLAKGGRTAYFGARADATAHFGALGHACPPSWNPPDFFIDLVSEGHRDEVVRAFAERNAPPPPPPAAEPLQPRPRPGFLATTLALLRRAQVKVRRSYLQPSEWYLVVLLSVVFGVLWWQVGAERRHRQRDYISIIFFFVAQWSWAPLFQAVNNFPSERNVLTRERASDAYSIGPWYVAKVLSELPLSWLLPAAFFAIVFPMAAMPPESVATLFGVNLLNVEVASSLGYFIAASFFDRTKATTCAIVAMVFVMCAGGYFVDLTGPNMPPLLSYLRYTSFWYYSLGLWMHYALPADADAAAFAEELRNFSFSSFSADGRPEVDVLALIGQAALARFAAYIVLRRSRKLEFS